MIFPHDIHNPPAERTHDDYLQQLESARRGEDSFGVMGETPLAQVLEIPQDVAIDYMHAVSLSSKSSFSFPHIYIYMLFCFRCYLESPVGYCSH